MVHLNLLVVVLNDGGVQGVRSATKLRTCQGRQLSPRAPGLKQPASGGFRRPWRKGIGGGLADGKKTFGIVRERVARLLRDVFLPPPRPDSEVSRCFEYSLLLGEGFPERYKKFDSDDRRRCPDHWPADAWRRLPKPQPRAGLKIVSVRACLHPLVSVVFEFGY